MSELPVQDAQAAALRRTMEKYSNNVRLILLANSTAGIIANSVTNVTCSGRSFPTGQDLRRTQKRARENWKAVPASMNV